MGDEYSLQQSLHPFVGDFSVKIAHFIATQFSGKNIYRDKSVYLIYIALGCLLWW